MKLPLTDDEFRLIYSKVPRLNVEIVINTEDGIVLTKRSINPWKGYWHLPGGTVYMNETLEEAVRRIALDEVGLKVEAKELLGYVVYPSIKAHKGLGWPVGIAFSASTISGSLEVNENGEAAKKFKQLPVNIIQEQKDFIEQKSLIQPQ